MKKVAFIYSGSAGRGGLSTYLKLLFKNLKSEKFELVLFSIGPWETSREIEKGGSKVVYLPTSKVFSLKTLRELKKAIKKEQISLLITAGMVSNFYGRLASLYSNLPIITTIHSDWKTDYPGVLKRVLYFLSDRILRLKTTKYIAVSNYLKNMLVKEGIPNEKIEVIYNGVELTQKHAKTNSKNFTIGSVGRLHYTKGFDVLIKAIKSLPENVNLKIWGDGTEKDRLQKLIDNLKLENRVKLMGRAENVEDAFGELDIYIQPSRMEGFGLTVVEAMGSGLPVVVSNKGSLPEIVKNNKTGLVAELTPEDLGAKVKILLDDENLRKTIATNAKETVAKEFSIEKWLSKMKLVIEQNLK